MWALPLPKSSPAAHDDFDERFECPHSLADQRVAVSEEGDARMATSRLKAVDSLNTFNFEADASNPTPYRLQGKSMYETSPFKQERQSVRKSSKLRSCCLQFWTVAGLSEQDLMPKDKYVLIHRRISKALAPELSHAEATEAAEEDWEEDRAGAAAMTFEQYANGLTGIADMWTETVDELEYVIFLNKLFRRITVLRETRTTDVAAFSSPAAPIPGTPPPSAAVATAAPGLTARPSVVAPSSLFATAVASLSKVEPSATLAPAAAGEPVASPHIPHRKAQQASRAGSGAVSFATPIASGSGCGGLDGDSGRRNSSGGRSADKHTPSKPKWRGLLQSFRAFRDLPEIVPMTEPTQLKPEGNGTATTPHKETPSSTPGAARASKEAPTADHASRTLKAEGRKAAQDAKVTKKSKKSAEEKDKKKKSKKATAEKARPQPIVTETRMSAAREAGLRAAELREKRHGKEEAEVAEAPPQKTTTRNASITVGNKDVAGISSPPPVPLTVPSDDEDAGEPSRLQANADAPRSSFSLKRRGNGGWYDHNGQQIQTPRSMLRGIARARNAHFEADQMTPGGVHVVAGGRSRRLAQLAPSPRDTGTSGGQRGEVSPRIMPRSVVGHGGLASPFPPRSPFARSPRTPGSRGNAASNLTRARRTPRGHATYIKGLQCQSPARLEGGTQSDGEEEIHERRSLLSRALVASAARGGAAGDYASKASAVGAPFAHCDFAAPPTGLLAPASMSDDEEDYAYIAMKPKKMVSLKTELTSSEEGVAGGARHRKGVDRWGAALRDAARRRYGSGAVDSDEEEGDDNDKGRARYDGAESDDESGGGSDSGGGSSSGDDEDEDEDDELPARGVPAKDQKAVELGVKPSDGWGASPPKRRGWWRLREKARREALKKDADSEAAAQERKKQELLSKSLALLRPLVFSPLGSSARAKGGTDDGNSGAYGSVTALEESSRKADALTDQQPLTSPGSRLSSPRKLVKAALHRFSSTGSSGGGGKDTQHALSTSGGHVVGGATPGSLASRSTRSRRNTHDGTTSEGTASPASATDDVATAESTVAESTVAEAASVSAWSALARETHLDAEAAAVFNIYPSEGREALATRVGEAADLRGWGPTPIRVAGPGVVATAPKPHGLASSLGGAYARRVALDGLPGGRGASGPPVGTVDIRKW